MIPHLGFYRRHLQAAIGVRTTRMTTEQPFLWQQYEIMSDIIAVSRYYNKCYYRQYSEIKTNGCFELNRHLMKISQFIMC